MDQYLLGVHLSWLREVPGFQDIGNFHFTYVPLKRLTAQETHRNASLYNISSRIPYTPVSWHVLFALTIFFLSQSTTPTENIAFEIRLQINVFFSSSGTKSRTNVLRAECLRRPPLTSRGERWSRLCHAPKPV